MQNAKCKMQNEKRKRERTKRNKENVSILITVDLIISYFHSWFKITNEYNII